MVPTGMDTAMKFPTVLFLLLTFSVYCQAGQRELMEKKVRELIELNKIVVEKNIDLKKLNNQMVFIRVRLQQVSENEYNVKVEEVSAEGIKAIKDKDGREDKETVVVKAKISEQSDKTFHLDIDHVLPPEKQEPDKKEMEMKK